MKDCFEKCFVCGEKETLLIKNATVNLPVCQTCRGSEAEKVAITTLQQGLAEGFACGCI
jgi:hypothetical protein